MTEAPITPSSADAWLPPIVNTRAGQARKVGIELEFTGISHGRTTRALESWAQQDAVHQSLVEARVTHRTLGEFAIEVDWRYLKETAQEQQITEGSEAWVRLLKEAARLVVPIEVIAPPLAIRDLPQLEALVECLRQAGAQGTGDSPIAAYGLHLNAEVPELSTDAITPYLQAFALLQWWLVARHQVDMTRRLSTYVHLYSEDYLDKVLRYPAPPPMDQLLADYFAYNPSRNRALDLWPLFAEYAPDKVNELLDEPLIKARPTFHYRLPNCEIDRPTWRLEDEWGAWLVVEKLAADIDSLQQLTSRYFSAKRPLFGINKRHWIKTMDEWVRSL